MLLSSLFWAIFSKLLSSLSAKVAGPQKVQVNENLVNDLSSKLQLKHHVHTAGSGRYDDPAEQKNFDENAVKDVIRKHLAGLPAEVRAELSRL